MNLRKYVIGLHKQIRRLNSFKVAYQEWSDKTDWVQESAHWSELGKHRADVISERFAALKAESESLRQFILGLAEYDAEIAYSYAALNRSPENPS